MHLKFCEKFYQLQYAEQLANYVVMNYWLLPAATIMRRSLTFVCIMEDIQISSSRIMVESEIS